MSKGEAYRRYELHGEGVESIALDAIGMPAFRQPAAIAAIKAIIAANDVRDLVWYKVPNTAEIAAYWEGCRTNKLWIEAGNVHVDPDVSFPLTVTGLKGGVQPMHHLPGVTPGSGGGRSERIESPMPCHVCFNPHGTDEDCY
jgi:hypothetical protein